VVETLITDSEILASDKATNVVIGVTTNNASSSEINSALDSSATKVVTEDTMEVTGEKYSCSIEVCWEDDLIVLCFQRSSLFFPLRLISM
jgi:activating signal cointegrator complex subunit 1